MKNLRESYLNIYILFFLLMAILENIIKIVHFDFIFVHRLESNFKLQFLMKK